MINKNNTFNNLDNSALRQAIQTSSVANRNVEMNYDVRKRLTETGMPLPRQHLQDITNRQGDNYNRWIRPSPRKGAMSGFNPQINFSPISRAPQRSIPSGENFPYNQPYIATIITSPSLNRSTTSSENFVSVGGVGKNKRPRKARSIFSAEQLKILNDEFERHNYINNFTREELASKTGITPEQVKIWFQNMRSKRRKSYERAAQNNFGFDYATLQQYGNISSMNTSIPLMTHFIRGQPTSAPFANPHSATNVIHPAPGSYSGSNSSSGSNSFTYNNPNDPRTSNGHGNPLNVNRNNSISVSTSQPTVYWESSNKNHQSKLNNTSGYASANSSHLPPFNPNNQSYPSQQPHNYPVKDSRNINSTAPGGINSTAVSHVQITNNKSSNFIAPGFASTLYNAKMNGENKNGSADSNQSKTSSAYVLNRPVNAPLSHEGGRVTQSTKQYVTSTPQPQPRNSGQSNSSNFQKTSLPSFNETTNSTAKPKICPPTSTVPTDTTSTSQQPSHQPNGSNTRPNP